MFWGEGRDGVETTGSDGKDVTFVWGEEDVVMSEVGV